MGSFLFVCFVLLVTVAALIGVAYLVNDLF